MKWHLVGLLLVTVIAGGLITAVSERGRGEAERQKFENDSLRAVADARLFSLDTIKARNAEREIRAAKANDSLRTVVATAQSIKPVIVHDTVKLTLTQYVYWTDTLLPACQRCAARVESLIAQNRVERKTSDDAIAAEHAWGATGWKVAEKEAKKAKRAKVKTAGAFVIGTLLGAWVRGQ